MQNAKLRITKPGWIALLICVVGIGLRLWNANAPLWGDETISWVIARRAPFFAMWQLASTNPTSPLFYSLLHFTLLVGGDSPIGVRLLSLICGALTLPAVYWSTRQGGFSRSQSLIAMAITAGSSVLIYYAQEARVYAFLTLLATLSLGLIMRSLRQPSRTIMWVYGLVALLAAYAHGYGMLLIACEGLILLLFRRWKLSVIAFLAVFLAVLPIVWRILNHTYVYGGGNNPTTLNDVLALLMTLSAGTLGMQHETMIPKPELLRYPSSDLNNLLPWVGGLILLMLIGWSVYAYRQSNAQQRQSMRLVWLCIAVPAVGALLSGILPVSYSPWLLRGLVYLCPFYAIAVAAVCRTRWPIAILVPLILVINGVALYPYYTRYTRFEGAQAFQQLEQRTTSDDLVIADPWYMHVFVRYYYRGPAPLVSFAPRKGWLDVDEMQQYDIYGMYPLSAQPDPRGNVYVFYQNADLQWVQQFPGHKIFIYDPNTVNWVEYQGAR